MTTPSKRQPAAALTVWAALLVTVAGLGIATALDRVGRAFPGFLVLGNGVVASVGLPAWAGTAGGEIFQARVTAVDGRPVGSPEALAALVAEAPAGHTPRYTFQRDGRVFDRAIETRRFGARDAGLIFGAYLVNGLFLGGVALLVLSRTRAGSGSRKAVPFLLCAAFWGLSGTGVYDGPSGLFRLHALCEALVFATAIQLALEFPAPLLPARTTRRWVSGGYAFAAAIAITYQWVLFEPAGYVPVHLLATSLGGASLLAIVIALLMRFFERRGSDDVGTALRVLAVGASLALMLPVALTLPELATGGSAPQNLVAWTVFVFPLSIGYAVRRYEPGDASPAAS